MSNCSCFQRATAKLLSSNAYARHALRAAVAMLFLLLAGETAFADDPSNRTGIELTAGLKNAKPPAVWRVYDANTNRVVSEVGEIVSEKKYQNARWGFMSVPPGTYRLGIVMPMVGWPELSWKEVTVKENETTKVSLSSGVKIQPRTGITGPYEWWLIDSKTKKQVSYVRWGLQTLLPPGRYELLVRQNTSGSVAMSWGTILVVEGKLTTIPLSSGIQLMKPFDKAPNLETLWIVGDQKDQSVVKTSYGSTWDFSPLPPGRYEVVSKPTSVRKSIVVKPNQLTQITMADLELGRLSIQPPTSRGLQLASGSKEINFQVIQGNLLLNKDKLKIDEKNPQVSNWIKSGPAILKMESGLLKWEQQITIRAGETASVPFNLQSLLDKGNVSVFTTDVRDEQHRAATTGSVLSVIGPQRQTLLALSNDPSPNTLWIVPVNSSVRVRRGKHQLVQKISGKREKLLFDFGTTVASTNGSEQSPRINIDIKIESPAKGTIVRSDQVEVIGRASSAGAAGATRIALVIDVSPSTDADSGADIDGDGKNDNILQAEVEAARRFLTKLAERESVSPGTAFEVAIVRFYGDAEIMSPAKRMSVPENVTEMQRVLDQIISDGFKGSTNYAAAFDTAQKALDLDNHPNNNFILFLSDGVPTNGVKVSLNAAARLGTANIDIYALGLGAAFQGNSHPKSSFRTDFYIDSNKPNSKDAADVLATVAQLGGPRSFVQALPRPADVIKIIAQLPITELPEAELKEVRLTNITTGKPATSVKLFPDGAFKAMVPVSLLPRGTHLANTIEATAVAMDGMTTATDQVQVKGYRPQPTRISVFYQSEPSRPPLPPALLPTVELILDASSSMAERMSRTGKSKYEVATNVTIELLAKLPTGIRAGLRLYGHCSWLTRPQQPRRNDPRMDRDSQLVVPISTLNRDQKMKMAQWIVAARPKGKTPMIYSLLLAKRDFPPNSSAPKVVVLVSDGIETCGGKMEDVVKAYQGSGIDVVINVVGFDVAGTEAEKQLKKFAEIGGGKYYSANDVNKLATSLRAAVYSSAQYIVYDPITKRTARGIVNGKPITLKPGEYFVWLVGNRDKAVRVRVDEGQTRDLGINENGHLVVPIAKTTGTSAGGN